MDNAIDPDLIARARTGYVLHCMAVLVPFVAALVVSSQHPLDIPLVLAGVTIWLALGLLVFAYVRSGLVRMRDDQMVYAYSLAERWRLRRAVAAGTPIRDETRSLIAASISSRARMLRPTLIVMVGVSLLIFALFLASGVPFVIATLTLVYGLSLQAYWFTMSRHQRSGDEHDASSSAASSSAPTRA